MEFRAQELIDFAGKLMGERMDPKNIATLLNGIKSGEKVLQPLVRLIEEGPLKQYALDESNRRNYPVNIH